MTKRNKAAMWIGIFALVVVVASCAGYNVGKDMALRDNARDAAAPPLNGHFDNAVKLSYAGAVVSGRLRE